MDEIKQIIKRNINSKEKTIDSKGIIADLKKKGLTSQNLLSENLPELQ